jgi:hypothetical protein
MQANEDVLCYVLRIVGIAQHAVNGVVDAPVIHLVYLLKRFAVAFLGTLQHL